MPDDVQNISSLNQHIFCFKMATQYTNCVTCGPVSKTCTHNDEKAPEPAKSFLGVFYFCL